MKKAALFCLVVFLALSPAFAKKQPASSSEASGSDNSSYLYLGLGTGAGLPGSNWDSNYYLGGGANLILGYQLDKNLGAQVDAEEWFFTGGGNSLYNLRGLAEVKYTFDSQGWQPYLLAGAGTVFQTLSPTGDNTANFDALGGLGVQFDLAPKTHLFLEAKYNFIMSETTTYMDLPISTGLWVGL